MRKYKLLSIILAFVLVFTLSVPTAHAAPSITVTTLTVDMSGVGKIIGYIQEAPEDTEIRFTPGTYTGKGFGFHSYVTVETTFSEDAITAVTVVANSGETPYLRDLAAEKIPAEIVEQQSLNVDVVTGATWGSTAIIKAVADCVKQAAVMTEFLKGILK